MDRRQFLAAAMAALVTKPAFEEMPLAARLFLGFDPAAPFEEQDAFIALVTDSGAEATFTRYRRLRPKVWWDPANEGLCMEDLVWPAAGGDEFDETVTEAVLYVDDEPMVRFNIETPTRTDGNNFELRWSKPAIQMMT